MRLARDLSILGRLFILLAITTLPVSANLRSELQDPRACSCDTLISTALAYSDSAFLNELSDEDLLEQLNESLELNLNLSDISHILWSCLKLEYMIDQDSSLIEIVRALPMLVNELYQARRDSFNRWSKEFPIHDAKIWRNIDSQSFAENLLSNIIHPNRMNQGRGTYFCGYAAFMHYITIRDPKGYFKLVVDLYNDGEAYLGERLLTTGLGVRQVAGILDFEGITSKPLDQMIFLTLAENFQESIINTFHGEYELGKETTTRWAGTTVQEFDQLLKIYGFQTYFRGSNIANGKKFKYVKRFARSDLQLFVLVNSNRLKKNNHLKNVCGTHIMQLEGLYVQTNQMKDKKLFSILTWDYGGWRVYQNICAKKFNQMTYAYVAILGEEHLLASVN